MPPRPRRPAIRHAPRHPEADRSPPPIGPGPKITEAAFQAQVIALARRKGWLVAHFMAAQNSRGDFRTPVAGDGRGFPDLVLVREVTIYAELKAGRNNLEAHQVMWRDALLDAGARWYVWWPGDWDDIVRVLTAPA